MDDEKKKKQQSKVLNALVIGFLAGIVFIGIVSSILAKKFVILIPLFFPAYFIYKLLKKSNKQTLMERSGLMESDMSSDSQKTDNV